MTAEIAGRKKKYDAFVKELEGTSLDGGAPGMEKLCALMWRCIPQDCQVMLETDFRNFFGDSNEENFDKVFGVKNYNDLAKECIVNSRAIAVCYDGDISVTNRKEESLPQFGIK